MQCILQIYVVVILVPNDGVVTVISDGDNDGPVLIELIFIVAAVPPKFHKYFSIK